MRPKLERRLGWWLAGALAFGCSGDPTPEALTRYEAFVRAHEALASGANQADLDGDGRAEFSRTRADDGRVLTQEVDIDGDGRPELRWDFGADIKTLRVDVGHDGVAERAIDVRFDPERPGVARYEVYGDTSGNGVPDERTSYAVDPALDTIEVLIERDPEEDGRFVESERTSAPRVAPQEAPFTPFVQTDPALPGHCNPDEAVRLQEALRGAMNRGMECLASVSKELEQEVLTALSIANVQLRCLRGRDVCGQTDLATSVHLFEGRPPEDLRVLPIEVNLDPGPGCGSLEQVVFHEMLHYVFGPHTTGPLAVFHRQDRMYGCERMCYGCTGEFCDTLPSFETACPACLGVEAAEDPRCEALEPADDGDGGEGGNGGAGSGGENGGGQGNMGPGADPGVSTGSDNGAAPCVGSAEFCEGFQGSPGSPWGGAFGDMGGEEGRGGQPSDPRPPRSWGDVLGGLLDDLIGAILGDPHLVTFDGVLFDFQAVGEFTLVDDGAGFTVQVRQAPWGDSQSVSVVTGVATRLGAARVALYVDQSPPLYVDGAPVALAAGMTLDGGGSIEHDRGNYTLVWPSGERLRVRVASNLLDVLVSFPRARARSFVGLLGNANADGNDDFALADGTPLERPLSRETLYGDFAASWRITNEQSLFDYPPGASTADFSDPTFPRHTLSAALLGSSDYAAGMVACTSNGVRGRDVLEACVLDYAVTREPGVVRGYRDMPLPISSDSVVTYRNGYEGEHDGALSSAALARVPSGAVLGNNGYAGPFGPGAVTFRREGLPPHDFVTVAFDLYTLGPWNNTGFVFRSGGVTLLDTTFSNGDAPQAFPDFVGVGSHAARSGAVLVGALGADGAEPDAVYHHRFTFAHAADTLELELAADAAADPAVRFAIDNLEVDVGAPPGATQEELDGSVVLHGPAGAPEDVGCADGRREALLDPERYPDIAGCYADWAGTASLRAPTTGVACGDGIGPCGIPADACAPGWHVCGESGLLDELLRLSPDECENAGAGRYSAALSHCGAQSGCVYADSPDDAYECYPSGWCSEAVCCGSECRSRGGCPSGVWPSRTQITIGTNEGCGAVTSERAGGVLCCR